MNHRGKRRILDQPPEVVKRWAAIKTIRTFKPYIEGFFLAKLRLRLILTERKRAKALKSTFETILKEFRKLDKSEFEATKSLFNISLYFLLAERDLHSVKIDAFSHPNPWKRNLSLRIMLLIIHERDMSKVASGKVMSQIYDQVEMSEETKKEMISSLRAVNKVQKKVTRVLSETRNATIAHRDPDSLGQFEIIDNLNIMKMKGLLEEYYSASNTFVSTIPKVIEQASSLRSMLNQYSASRPNKSMQPTPSAPVD